MQETIPAATAPFVVGELNVHATVRTRVPTGWSTVMVALVVGDGVAVGNGVEVGLGLGLGVGLGVGLGEDDGEGAVIIERVGAGSMTGLEGMEAGPRQSCSVGTTV